MLAGEYFTGLKDSMGWVGAKKAFCESTDATLRTNWEYSGTCRLRMTLVIAKMTVSQLQLVLLFTQK